MQNNTRVHQVQENTSVQHTNNQSAQDKMSQHDTINGLTLVSRVRGRSCCFGTASCILNCSILNSTVSIIIWFLCIINLISSVSFKFLSLPEYNNSNRKQHSNNQPLQNNRRIQQANNQLMQNNTRVHQVQENTSVQHTNNQSVPYVVVHRVVVGL
jgi:hypothetical protein